jgi:hypothetical protein
VAAWDDLAFHQHLPENYKIRENLIRTYHERLTELEQATSFKLQNFRVAPDAMRPRVVSATYATRQRPSRVNYSEDNFCQRTNVLMKLEGLLHFLGLQLRLIELPGPEVNSRTLLPHESISLALYRFAESTGKRTMAGNLPRRSLAGHKSDQPLVVGENKRLHTEQFLGVQKQFDGVKQFVTYAEDTGVDEKVFYRGDFQLKVLPRGRPCLNRSNTGRLNLARGCTFHFARTSSATVVGEKTAGAANPARPLLIDDLLDVTIPFGHIESAVEGPIGKKLELCPM